MEQAEFQPSCQLKQTHLLFSYQFHPQEAHSFWPQRVPFSLTFKDSWRLSSTSIAAVLST